MSLYDDRTLPWAESARLAGELLARLHGGELPARLPPGPPGACAECSTIGPRLIYGRFPLCVLCVVRRSLLAKALAS